MVCKDRMCKKFCNNKKYNINCKKAKKDLLETFLKILNGESDVFDLTLSHAGN